MKKVLGFAVALLFVANAAQALDPIEVVGVFGGSGQASIAVFEDNDGTTPATSLTFDTAALNANFPNTTTGWFSATADRLYVVVTGGLGSDWDVSMFSNNTVAETGLIHKLYDDEIIKLKYRASSWEGTYDAGTLVDGQLYAGDFFASYRWIVNSTTGAFADLLVDSGQGVDEKAFSLIASGDVDDSDGLDVPAWDYSKPVEIIFLLGLIPGDQGDGYNANLTADKPGEYRTGIVFEVVNY